MHSLFTFTDLLRLFLNTKIKVIFEFEVMCFAYLLLVFRGLLTAVISKSLDTYKLSNHTRVMSIFGTPAKIDS